MAIFCEVYDCLLLHIEPQFLICKMGVLYMQWVSVRSAVKVPETMPRTEQVSIKVC